MSTETRDNKIAIDAKNGERFALVDNGKVVEIFDGCASKSAIAGNRNKITTNGIQPYTAVVGCSPVINCAGKNNNIISFGPYTTFSGTAGNCIAVAEYDYERRVVGIVTGWIGENGLKENVRYSVRKGQFVEAPE